MFSGNKIWTLACLFVLMACTPARDWREVSPEGGGIQALFPCRPQHHMRSMGLPQVVAPMHLLVCHSGEQTFALGYLDVAAPGDVASALVALRNAAKANMRAVDSAAVPLRIAGMTPNQDAALVSMKGLTPEGTTLKAQIGFFAKGLRVYQATVYGADLGEEVLETFFSGLKLP